MNPGIASPSWLHAPAPYAPQTSQFVRVCPGACPSSQLRYGPLRRLPNDRQLDRGSWRHFRNESSAYAGLANLPGRPTGALLRRQVRWTEMVLRRNLALSPLAPSKPPSLEPVVPFQNRHRQYLDAGCGSTWAFCHHR